MENKCQECGGVMGAHRSHCKKSDTPTDPHWITCDCGHRVWLLPIADYLVEKWAGCHLHHTCDKCPLHDPAALQAKINKLFPR